MELLIVVHGYLSQQQHSTIPLRTVTSTFREEARHSPAEKQSKVIITAA
jgi:hypothetical protein